MGRHVAAAFDRDGWHVASVGRTSGDARFGDTGAITALVDGADLVLNLAGRSVNCRYTPANRAEILRSRVDTTAELGRAVAATAVAPRLWINSSTATIYRHADDRPQTDEPDDSGRVGEIGSGFSVDVATAWEREFFAHSRDGMRQVAIRTAIVIGDGSALVPLLTLARFGLGGPQLGGRSGGGRQMFSWIHLDDVYRAIRFIEQTPQLSGAVNLAAPAPLQNRDMMRALRGALGVRFGLPAFEWMLRLGAVAIRTETELVLKSRWVLPARLTAAGFEFAFPTFRDAVDDVLANRAAAKQVGRSDAGETGQG